MYTRRKRSRSIVIEFEKQIKRSIYFVWRMQSSPIFTYEWQRFQRLASTQNSTGQAHDGPGWLRERAKSSWTGASEREEELE